MADSDGLGPAASHFDPAAISLNISIPHNQHEPNKLYLHYYSYFYAKLLDSTCCVCFTCYDISIYWFVPFEPPAIPYNC